MSVHPVALAQSIQHRCGMQTQSVVFRLFASIGLPLSLSQHGGQAALLVIESQAKGWSKNSPCKSVLWQIQFIALLCCYERKDWPDCGHLQVNVPVSIGASVQPTNWGVFVEVTWANAQLFWCNWVPQFITSHCFIESWAVFIHPNAVCLTLMISDCSHHLNRAPILLFVQSSAPEHRASHWFIESWALFINSKAVSLTLDLITSNCSSAQNWKSCDQMVDGVVFHGQTINVQRKDLCCDRASMTGTPLVRCVPMVPTIAASVVGFNHKAFQKRSRIHFWISHPHRVVESEHPAIPSRGLQAAGNVSKFI